MEAKCHTRFFIIDFRHCFNFLMHDFCLVIVQLFVYKSLAMLSWNHLVIQHLDKDNQGRWRNQYLNFLRPLSNLCRNHSIKLPFKSVRVFLYKWNIGFNGSIAHSFCCKIWIIKKMISNIYGWHHHRLQILNQACQVIHCPLVLNTTFANVSSWLRVNTIRLLHCESVLVQN